jgi:hypothetical protein
LLRLLHQPKPWHWNLVMGNGGLGGGSAIR